jgi:hypothetical protein
MRATTFKCFLFLSRYYACKEKLLQVHTGTESDLLKCICPKRNYHTVKFHTFSEFSLNINQCYPCNHSVVKMPLAWAQYLLSSDWTGRLRTKSRAKSQVNSTCGSYASKRTEFSLRSSALNGLQTFYN